MNTAKKAWLWSGPCLALLLSAATNELPPGFSGPKDYRQMIQRVRQRQMARDNLDTVQSAVQLFQFRFARLPADLKELVDRHILPELPPAPPRSTYYYDRALGNVRLVPLPESAGGDTNAPAKNPNLLTP